MERSPQPKALSARELEVLQLVAVGWTNQRIATELELSTGTINLHLHHILRKLKVSNRVQAVCWLMEYRLQLSTESSMPIVGFKRLPTSSRGMGGS